MRVILAKKAGFCMGVRRAVEITLDTVRLTGSGISTFGPLIHNPQVLDLLSEQGVTIQRDIPEKGSKTVIIRAHGVPPAVKERLFKSGFKVKDATCPRVVKVQAIIKKYREQGCATVIIGDRNHAEVEGLMGFAGPSVFIVSNKEDVKDLDLPVPYIIVSQTTQDEESFKAISRLIMERFPGGTVFNTICDSTHKRQEEVRNLSSRVQAMVVVGGRFSANTKRLADIAKGKGCKVFLVETEKDLNISELAEFETVGVTAGASTPTWMINRVVRTLESIPSRGEGTVPLFLYRLMRLLLITNVYLSLAGGMLVFTCAALKGVVTSPEHFLIAFGYLFAMHSLNRLMDHKATRFSDPVMELFFQRHRKSLLCLNVVALVSALIMAFRQGMPPFIILACMSLFGILYSVRFIPKSISNVVKVRGLKEIPGSKTLFVAMAWAFVIVLIPGWNNSSLFSPVTAGTFIFVLFFVFVRNALFDVFEVQGDRILGKETLPVCIGEKKTITLLYIIMGFLVCSLLLMPLAGWMTSVGFWLIPGVAYLIGLTYLYNNNHFLQGPKLEFGLETVFWIVAGLGWLGLIWKNEKDRADRLVTRFTQIWLIWSGQNQEFIMLGWFKGKLGFGKEKEALYEAEEPASRLKAGSSAPFMAVEREPEAVPEELAQPEEPAVAEQDVILEDQLSSKEQAVSPGPSESEHAERADIELEIDKPDDLKEEPSAQKGMFQRLRERLSKTRDSFVRRVDELFLGKRVIDSGLLDELEEVLITADLGARTAQELIDDARTMVARKELNDPASLKKAIKKKILDYLLIADKPAELVMPESGPFVVMVVGVNGVGKTTTIGKMGYKFVQSGQNVLLVAGDTFRAAAIEQLQIWGQRIGVDVIAQKTGADPSSVVYDAIDYARRRQYDVVIMDTAGRLHTKVNLMEELKKIKRVMAKKLPGAPHEIMLVLDATTGQNAISQARLFCEAVGITGITLTKLDGTAKGGIVVNISHEFGIPIRFIGIGEKMEDLRDFDPEEFVEALFGASNR